MHFSFGAITHKYLYPCFDALLNDEEKDKVENFPVSLKLSFKLIKKTKLIRKIKLL